MFKNPGRRNHGESVSCLGSVALCGTGHDLYGLNIECLSARQRGPNDRLERCHKSVRRLRERRGGARLPAEQAHHGESSVQDDALSDSEWESGAAQASPAREGVAEKCHTHALRLRCRHATSRRHHRPASEEGCETNSMNCQLEQGGADVRFLPPSAPSPLLREGLTMSIDLI